MYICFITGLVVGLLGATIIFALLLDDTDCYEIEDIDDWEEWLNDKE